VEIHQTLSSLLIIYKPSDLVKNCFNLGWGGYHKSVKEFLASVNDNHKPEQWPLLYYICTQCPAQNPVEDVWLQAKT